MSSRHTCPKAQALRPGRTFLVALTLAFCFAEGVASASGETKPAETKHGEAKPGETKHGETKHGEPQPVAAPPADASVKPMRVASLTAPAAPARPAPPKEPAAVAPKPTAAPASAERPAARSAAPPSQNGCAAVAELRSELREALNGEAHDLSAEQREEREHLESELTKERATHQALLTAVERGVPRATIAEAIEGSEKRVGELVEKIAAVKPARSRGLATVHDRLDALAISLQAIELKLSAAGPETEAAPPAADRPAGAEASPAEAPKTIGLNVDAGFATLYAFRGLNVFKASSQMDQHALFAPGITYNPTWAEGLSVGYWGAYQVTGDNASQLVKQGVGNEQDLTVSYGRDVVKEKVQARVGVTNYVYPFAERAIAKTSTPYVFEPWGQMTYVGTVTASFLATYFYGTQEAIRPNSYIYMHPAVEKTFAATKAIGFVPGAGLGYKIFTNNSALTDNRYEVTGDMKMPIASGENTYVTPGLHYAWSNFSNGAVGSAHAVFLSMNIGLNL